MARTAKTPAQKAANKAESKRDKFVRLATARTNKALKAIQQIGGLANKNSYDFATADATAVVDALTGAMTNVQTKFDNALSNKPVTAVEGFKLPGA